MPYLVMPCEGRPTDAFGMRDAVYDGAGRLIVPEQRHTGRDIAAPAGTPIRPAAPGRVIRVWWDTFLSGAPAGGWMIAIDHGGGVETRYAHLLERPALAPDAWADLTTTIGLVGATGAATGNHLHLEVLINGAYVDPDLYLHEEDIVTPEDIEKIAQRTAALILDTQVDRQGTRVDGKPQSGKTTLRAWIGWLDHAFASTIRGVLDTQVDREGKKDTGAPQSGKTTLRAWVAWLDHAFASVTREVKALRAEVETLKEPKQ